MRRGWWGGLIFRGGRLSVCHVGGGMGDRPKGGGDGGPCGYGRGMRFAEAEAEAKLHMGRAC